MENAAMPEKGAESTVPIKVVVVGVLAATAGLMSGLDIGVISGALDFLARDFNASTLAQEWIVSAMMAGAAVGAVGAGWITRHTGRKWSLVFGGGVFIAGSLLCALAWSVPVLITGRVLMGLAIGVAAFAAPLYLSEVSDQSSRGAMISTYQLMITIGIFLAFLSDTFFSYHGQWRWMFGIIAIPGIVYVIGVLFLPYSPRWLMMRGRRAEALEVLTSLRATPQEARAEIKAIHNQLQARQNGWSLLRANGNFRRSVGLGMLLQVMQQFAGINVVMYYAPRIFQLAGFVGTAQMWCTAMIGLVNVMATFLAISLVDKWGAQASFVLWLRHYGAEHGEPILAAPWQHGGSGIPHGMRLYGYGFYCSSCHVCRADCVGSVFGNSANAGQGSGHYAFHPYKLDCQHDCWCFFFKRAGMVRGVCYLWNDCRIECLLFRADIFVCARNQRHQFGAD